jgi:hypothetical protein
MAPCNSLTLYESAQLLRTEKDLRRPAAAKSSPRPQVPQSKEPLHDRRGSRRDGKKRAALIQKLSAQFDVNKTAPQSPDHKTRARRNKSVRSNLSGVLPREGFQFGSRNMEFSLRRTKPINTSATIVLPRGPRRCPPPSTEASASK